MFEWEVHILQKLNEELKRMMLKEDVFDIQLWKGEQNGDYTVMCTVTHNKLYVQFNLVSYIKNFEGRKFQKR